MQKSIIFLATLCFYICAAAQKPVVIVDHFTGSACKKGDLINLRNQVIAGIHETGNINLIDVESEDVLAMEAERRSSESALADETARLGVMKTLGANYVISGTASKLGADRKRSDYYTGNVSFSLKVVNVEDGTLVGAETYTYSNMSGGSGTTADAALYETLNVVKRAMAEFVSKYFKTTGTIVELDEIKNGRLKTCYINLGSGNGVEEKEEFTVLEVKMIAGIEGIETVGKIKVEKIVAGGLAKCKITAGADDILNAFQAGHELRIEAKDAKKTKQSAAEAGRDALEVGRTAAKAGKTALEIGAGISKFIKLLK